MAAGRTPMRTKFGVFFMFLGFVMILGSLGLLFYNTWEEKQAELFSSEVITVLREEVYQIQETKGESNQQNPIKKIPVELAENIPVELLTEEDLKMTEKVIKGHAYIGYVSIPDLKLQLPVMSQWSNQKLQISPCRYSGTLRGRDLVIMAHSFDIHFGFISTLSEGAQIQFTDMDGNVWNYEVAVMDVLGAYDVENMIAGEYDLTLFTCTKDRQHRVTVRCNMIEK